MVLAFASPRPAAAIDAAMIEAAKKEGSVVWYTTLIVDQLVRPLAADFEKRYGIKLEYYRANSADVAIKVINESRAGRVQADVIDGTTASGSLNKEGLVLPFAPDELKTYPDAMVDPAKSWIVQVIQVLTPAYNTSLIKPGTQPKTLDDLLDPKWKGQITWSSAVSTSGGPGFIGTILATQGEEAGMAYLRKLAQQKIVNRDQSAREVLDQVIAGESEIALQIFDHHPGISAKKGAPVEMIPLEPATVNFQIASIVKNSPHPNAAKLLLSYMISDDGQKVFREADYLPAQPRIPAKDPKLKPEGGGFKAYYQLPAEIDQKMPHWVDVFTQLFR